MQRIAGEREFRELSAEDEALLRRAAASSDGIAIASTSAALVESLHRRHLVYISVPITGNARLAAQSLEGFVSNRDAVAGDDADPMEMLLYELFVANSERLPLRALARVLDKPLADIQRAASLACRLGYARLADGGTDGAALACRPIPKKEPPTRRLGRETHGCAAVTPRSRWCVPRQC